MTKMAAIPIYGKKLLLRNQKAYNLETWYVELGCSSTTKNIKVKVIHCPWFKVTQFNIFIFFLDTAWPIEAKFYVEPSWDVGTKVWSTGLGHMTNMSAMPVYDKNLKNHLLWNQNADDLESWYSITAKYIQMTTLGWPWPILHKVKFGPLSFCIGQR